MDKQTAAALSQKVSIARVILLERAPFFATLAFHADVKFSTLHDTAWTNGRHIFFNPDFAASLSNAAFTSVFLHEILHCALDHVRRCQNRKAVVWNVAADYVVNALLDENGLLCNDLPWLRDRSYDDHSVEDLYRFLLICMDTPTIRWYPYPAGDLIAPVLKDSEILPDEACNRAHWNKAWKHAVVYKSSLHGSVAANLLREVGKPTQPLIEWRIALARYLTSIPIDFSEFDRRFIHKGVYTETLGELSARVVVCIDTSGSISDNEFNQFISELNALLGCFPGIECQLFYADTELHGPYDLRAGSKLPDGSGGGGTSFVPLFDWLDNQCRKPVDVVFYLTDGWGKFPDTVPPVPVVWVVTPGGACNEHFRFGETIRLPA